MKKRRSILSLLSIILICAMVATPFSVAAASENENGGRQKFYLEAYENGYRRVDTVSYIDKYNISHIEVSGRNTIFENEDQRYFYPATEDLFLEVEKIEIPISDSSENVVSELNKYNLPIEVIKRVTEIKENANNLISIEVFFPLSLTKQSTTLPYEGYHGNMYQDYIVFSKIETPFVEMFNSEEETKESMGKKKLEIMYTFFSENILSEISCGTFSFLQLGIDLSNVDVVTQYNSWTQSVQARVDHYEKLTTILIGNESMLGARTSSASWDFIEKFSAGVGTLLDLRYTRVFDGETPNYGDPTEMCYRNYFSGGKGEWLDNITHGFVTFSLP